MIYFNSSQIVKFWWWVYYLYHWQFIIIIFYVNYVSTMDSNQFSQSNQDDEKINCSYDDNKTKESISLSLTLIFGSIKPKAPIMTSFLLSQSSSSRHHLDQQSSSYNINEVGQCYSIVSTIVTNCDLLFLFHIMHILLSQLIID